MSPPAELRAHVSPGERPSDLGSTPDFLTSAVEVTLAGVSPARAHAAFLQLPVVEYFRGTDAFPPLARAEVLTPEWGPVGSLRRLTLEDESTALESVRASEAPGYLSFAVWQFSGSSGLVIGYAVTEWWFSEQPEGCQMTWRFSFRPRAWPSRWLLEGAIEEDYLAYMRQIARRFKERVELEARAR